MTLFRFFKILNDIDNLDKEIFFNITTDERTRGHTSKLAKERNRTTQRANAFSQRTVNDWNALPEMCVQSKTVNTFKDNLNEAWKKHPFKFDYTVRTPPARTKLRSVAKRDLYKHLVFTYGFGSR